MSEQPPFRAEALEHHQARGGPGSLLRVEARWTRPVFWLLLGLAVAGLLAGVLVKVDRFAFAPAAVQGREVRAAMPGALVNSVMAGDRARLILPGGGAVAARVAAFGNPTQQGTVIVVARTDRPVAGSAGTLRVRTGRRRLLADLVPGLSQ